MMIDFTTPLQGMREAEVRLDRTAARIASGPFEAPDSVDLSTEMVNLMQARNDFNANVKVAQTLDDMAKRTLDLIG